MCVRRCEIQPKYLWDLNLWYIYIYCISQRLTHTAEGYEIQWNICEIWKCFFYLTFNSTYLILGNNKVSWHCDTLCQCLVLYAAVAIE